MRLTFAETVSTPEHWFRQAWQMLEASQVLVEQVTKSKIVNSEKDLFRKVGSLKGAMLLLALSIENALKGLHVHISEPDLSSGKLNVRQFVDNGNPHDLNAIVRKLQYPISQGEEELLSRLTVFLIWAAKYQAPLKEIEHESAAKAKRLNFPNDVALAQELIKKLQGQAGFDPGNGWPAPNKPIQPTPKSGAADG